MLSALNRFLLPVSMLLIVLVFTISVDVQAEQNTENSSDDKPLLKYDPTGSNAWHPYYINDENNPGIVAEVISLVLKEANLIGEKVNLPPKRTNMALARGSLDFDLINPDWLPENEPLEHYVFSEPLIPIREHIIYLEGAEVAEDLGSDTQLLNQSLGTVRGYYYHNEDIFHRIDYPSEKELIKAIYRSRIKYAICGDKPAIYWANKLSVPIVIGPIHSDGFLKVRLRKEKAKYLPQINEAINTLLSNGKIDAILGKYL